MVDHGNPICLHCTIGTYTFNTGLHNSLVYTLSFETSSLWKIDPNRSVCRRGSWVPVDENRGKFLWALSWKLEEKHPINGSLRSFRQRHMEK